MDGILVNMVPPWLEKYNELTGESVTEESRLLWDCVEFVKYPDVLLGLLTQPGFFRNMNPYSGAIEYTQRLMDEGYDVVFVTTPPRTSEYAIKDKRLWIEEYFPKFDLNNIIFCDRKELVRGDILIDDSPHNISKWKKVNPKNLTASILYGPNATEPPDVDWLFENPNTAWKQIYEKIASYNKA